MGSLTSRRRLDVAGEPSTVRAAMGLTFVVAIVAALVGLGARATQSSTTSGDEPYYLLTAQALGHAEGLNIGPGLAAERYLPYHEVPLDQQAVQASDGTVSPHDPLLPVLLAPGVAVFGLVGARLTMAIIAAVTAALTTYVAITRFAVLPGLATLVVGGLYATLPLAAYGTQIYPEMPAALAVMSALVLLPQPHLTGAGNTIVGTRPVIALLGLLVSITALPWLSVKYVPVATGLALTAAIRLWNQGDRRRIVVAGALLAVAGVIYLAAHHAWYGGWTVYAAGDHFVDTGEFAVVGVSPDYLGRLRRVVGLLVDRSFGIGIWAPLWLLIPAAVASALRGGRRADREIVCLATLGWGVASVVALTMHGWWVPGRQLVVVLPLCAILIARLVQQTCLSRRVVVVGVALGATNWVWLAVEASSGVRTLIVDFAQTAALPYRALALVGPDGLAGGTVADLGLTLWTVALGASALWAWRAGMRPPTTTAAPARRPSPGHTFKAAR